MSAETPLETAADDLNARASEYSHFELNGDILRTNPDDGLHPDEFLLVGVNTDLDECVEIFESWLASHPVRVVSSEPMDDFPQVEVKEVRPNDDDREW